MPLAPLATQNQADVATLTQAVHSRLDREGDTERARELSATTFILLGLNHSDAFINTLTKGVQKMRESSTYQMILREGRNEGIAIGRDEGREAEARELLLRMGTRRYGAPTAKQQARIEAESSRAQLEVWLLSLLDAPDWNTVLAG